MDPNLGYVSPKPTSGLNFSKRAMLLGAGLLVAVITGIALLLASGHKDTSVQIQHLVARMDSLQTMLTDTKTVRNIRNEDLNNIITSFTLTITTDSNSLITALATDYPTKISESVAASEKDASSSQTIQDAYLENKLDSVYADTLNKKIASIRALIAEIYGITNNAKLKKTLVAIDDHMRTTSNQLENLRL